MQKQIKFNNVPLILFRSVTMYNFNGSERQNFAAALTFPMLFNNCSNTLVEENLINRTYQKNKLIVVSCSWSIFDLII